MKLLDKIKFRVQCFIYCVLILHIYLLCINYINDCKLIRKSADEYCSADSLVFAVYVEKYTKNTAFLYIFTYYI